MLTEKSLGEILNETFAVIGKEFKVYCVITLLVFVPFNLVLLMFDPQIMLRESPERIISSFDATIYVVVALLTLFAITVSFSLVSVATGQQIAFGRISLKLCFKRVIWRLYSLLFVNALIVVGILIAVIGSVLIIPAIGAIAFLIFSSMTLPVILFEGRKYISAIKRSFQLVRTAWGRVAVGMFLLTLLIIGGSIVISLPMMFVSSDSLTQIDQGGVWVGVVQYVLGVIANSFTTIVAGTATTLLYIDLRARSEELQLDGLRSEVSNRLNSTYIQNNVSKKSISIISSE